MPSEASSSLLLQRFAITPDDAALGLRAMATTALADGTLSPAEQSLLDASAAALGLAAASLDPIAADDLAAALPDPKNRERVLQAMILMTLMDGELHPAEVALIERYAAALGVDEPRVANLRQLAEGRVRRMWIDLARRSFARPIFEQTLREQGLRGVWKIVAPMVGLGADPALARRYNDLGLLPEGTFGRAYWDFIVKNDFGFPGEGTVAEQGVWHDLTHVLAGYHVDPEGECEVVAFIAGYRRDDPFFWLFTVALQFQLGLRISPYAPAAAGHLDPKRTLHAFERGLAMTKDLSTSWDFWADLPRPLDEVRRDYGVPPP